MPVVRIREMNADAPQAVAGQAGDYPRDLPMARSMCWHCQSEVPGEYFCGRCVKVQPLSKALDYFTCLNLPRTLNLDEKALEETFYALSRTFHPDYFATKDESEKAISLGNTALLNAAYRTLKDPIQRVEYLIRLEVGSAQTIRTTPPADLFDEILELQEDLVEFRSVSPHDAPERRQALQKKLQNDRQTLEARKAQMETRLSGQFAKWDALQADAGGDGAVRAQKDEILKEMRELLSNRTYVKNIVHDLAETAG